MNSLESKDLRRDVIHFGEKNPERIFINYKFQSNFKHELWNHKNLKLNSGPSSYQLCGFDKLHKVDEVQPSHL